jgi:hypothetical protein
MLSMRSQAALSSRLNKVSFGVGYPSTRTNSAGSNPSCASRYPPPPAPATPVPYISSPFSHRATTPLKPGPVSQHPASRSLTANRSASAGPSPASTRPTQTPRSFACTPPPGLHRALEPFPRAEHPRPVSQARRCLQALRHLQPGRDLRLGKSSSCFSQVGRSEGD